MDVGELVRLCGKGPKVLLVLPRKSLPRGYRTRFLRTRGPLGDILTVHENPPDGYRVLTSFDSTEVLDFVKRELERADNT